MLRGPGVVFRYPGGRSSNFGGPRSRPPISGGVGPIPSDRDLYPTLPQVNVQCVLPLPMRPPPPKLRTDFEGMCSTKHRSHLRHIKSTGVTPPFPNTAVLASPGAASARDRLRPRRLHHGLQQRTPQMTMPRWGGRRNDKPPDASRRLRAPP